MPFVDNIPEPLRQSSQKTWKRESTHLCYISASFEWCVKCR